MAFLFTDSIPVNFFLVHIASITNGAATKRLPKISGNNSSDNVSGWVREALVTKNGSHTATKGKNAEKNNQSLTIMFFINYML